MQAVKNISTKLNFANIISVIFHPILMPSYFLLILFNSYTYYFLIPFELKKFIFILVFLCSFLIPVSMIPLFMRLKVITNVQMFNRSERIIPYSIGALSYFFAAYWLSRFNHSIFDFIRIFMIASATLILLSAAISVKWKISAHLTGVGGLMSAIYFYGINFMSDFSGILAAVSIVAGVTAYSRLKLKAHSTAQVYSGFLLGFLGMLVMLIVL